MAGPEEDRTGRADGTGQPIPAAGSVAEEIIGIEVWFDTQPVCRYITVDNAEAPRLTAELIDDLCDSIDIYQVEHEAMAVTGIGQPLNLASRTLTLIRQALHAELYGIGSSDESGHPSRNTVHG